MSDDNFSANVICKICGAQETVRSMAMHLKWNHNIKTDKYVEQFGEFRPNKIKKLDKENTSNIVCKICNKNMMHNRQLMYHITKFHPEISQENYIIKYYYDNNPPKCKCGCGEKTTFKLSEIDKGYYTEYVKGHWSWIKPNWISHSQETKDKMRQIKIDNLKLSNNYFEGVSKGELELQNFLREYINIESNNRTILGGKELDIFIPELNLAIEYNGIHYHSDLFKEKNYHLKKTEECKAKSIRLVHIWENDWERKQDIVKSNLLNILGKTPNKIFARKCEIREVDSKTSAMFLDINHLQGNALSKIKLGLYYNDELVSLLTFSSIRRNLGGKSEENHWELLRFCNKLNTSVIGGMSKLFKHFIKKYTPKYIVSYANRDWSQGNVYYKLGMNFVKYTTPGYSYYKSKIKYNRFNFRKDILVKEGFDSNKTEYEIMSERGFHRVWNTGNLKFEWAS